MPDALSSSKVALSGNVWRIVEAQHQVSTLKLVDSLDEQAILEGQLESAKPQLPTECRHLDFLLATPFRYGAPYPKGSRFRRAGMSQGVYYASENVETAVAELVFIRLLFYAESPGIPWPDGHEEYTAFSVAFDTDHGIDLTAPPLNADRENWVSLEDYTETQTLADELRKFDVEALRYESVRDPEHRANIALLTCAAFAETVPNNRQTWRIRLGTPNISAICEFPNIRLGFSFDMFTEDSRLAPLN